MIDKYVALQNTTNWIVNSSSEEFMSTFNELGDGYGGMTLGDYIDLFIDSDLDINDIIEYNILTTEDFVFGADIQENDSHQFYINESYSMEELTIEKMQYVELPSNLQNCYDAANDELYNFCYAA